jgi:histone H3/H4
MRTQFGNTAVIGAFLFTRVVRPKMQKRLRASNRISAFVREILAEALEQHTRD